MRLLSTIVCLQMAFLGFSQEKKIIDHTVYNDWKSLKNTQISNDGRYIAYEINPHRGDGVLCIYDAETGQTDTIQRGYRASFSGGSSYLAFNITPSFDTLRTCELEKMKKDKYPVDSLGIYLLEKDTLLKYPELVSFSTNDENDWMAVEFKHNTLPVKDEKQKKRWCKRKKDNTPELKSDGHVLWMYHPDHEDDRFKDVTSFEMSEKGNYVAFTNHYQVAKKDTFSVNIFNTSSRGHWKDTMQYTSVKKFNFNNDEDQFSFLASSDTSKIKQYSLMLMSTDGALLASIDTTKVGLDTLHTISTNYTPFFTSNDNILYFGVGEREFEEPKDTLLEKEKVHLDLWHHADERLQPQQLKELKRDQTKSDLYAYHIKDGKTVQLSSDTLSVWASRNLKGNYLLGSSDERYAHTYNWVSPRPEDFYRVDVKTGEAKHLLTGQLFNPSLSPSGNHMVYFKDGNYYMSDIDAGSTDCISCDTSGIVWTSDMNGMPMEAYPIGGADWSRDESKVYLESEFDVWEYNRNTKELSSFTHEMGQLSNIELRPVKWEYDSVYFELSNLYFKGFDKTTKGIHFYDVKDHDDHVDLMEKAYFNAQVFGITRSKNKERSFFRKMTFEEYPEIFTFTDEMGKREQVSTTNPQQYEYNWGTVELTKWTSYDGKELEGLLYKPADFDTTKSYPLMVYFYELYSDRLHQHYIPKPTASIVYATEYTSAGYVFFIPDIRYEPGYPAKSAYDCIMSGTDHVLDLLPNVDSNRMALQGQSWGGYQTAQLITMTDRYAAAMAGAPVANMFSAYGGIRWGSGLNRQFQYERTQSRIGYTIWEKPELYVENSPLFHLPNVTTPLMIMHNDSDGAVPWYQGIELFTGLKRLGKTAWLLNYNDDDHNLMRNANRMDLSIRMRQFFDYYLLDAPAPKWLIDGIPATEKGKELRYELNEKE